MSKSLDDLLPEVKILAEQLISNCKSKYNLEVKITYTYRTMEEQTALYAQGRDTLEDVNKKREVAGLPPIGPIENRIVTNAKAGQSNHNFRVAFDVVPIINGKACWDTNNPAWNTIGEEGISLGLEWAGKWVKFKEFPHFQYLQALKDGKKAEEISGYWDHPISIEYKSI